MIGHLREEKDPLRRAIAARKLAADSRKTIHKYGQAHSVEWAELAKKEVETNPRYRSHGELPRNRLREMYPRTNLLVLPSRMEGGANVTSEAIVAAVPISASHIDGSVGLPGKNHPGYYPAENDNALAELLQQVESDPESYHGLLDHCLARRARFTLAGESAACGTLLSRLNDD